MASEIEPLTTSSYWESVWEGSPNRPVDPRHHYDRDVISLLCRAPDGRPSGLSLMGAGGGLPPTGSLVNRSRMRGIDVVALSCAPLRMASRWRGLFLARVRDGCGAAAGGRGARTDTRAGLAGTATGPRGALRYRVFGRADRALYKSG